MPFEDKPLPSLDALDTLIDQVGVSKPAPLQKSQVENLVRGAATKYNIDPDHLVRMANTESGGNANGPDSPKGAIGTMQLMPGTAQDLGVDPHDPRQNIEGGAKYFRKMLDQFDGDYGKASAAYNAGPARVARGGALPSETQKYVKSVMGSRDALDDLIDKAAPANGAPAPGDDGDEEFSRPAEGYHDLSPEVKAKSYQDTLQWLKKNPLSSLPKPPKSNRPPDPMQEPVVPETAAPDELDSLLDKLSPEAPKVYSKATLELRGKNLDTLMKFQQRQAAELNALGRATSAGNTLGPPVTGNWTNQDDIDGYNAKLTDHQALTQKVIDQVEAYKQDVNTYNQDLAGKAVDAQAAGKLAVPGLELLGGRRPDNPAEAGATLTQLATRAAQLRKQGKIGDAQKVEASAEQLRGSLAPTLQLPWETMIKEPGFMAPAMGPVRDAKGKLNIPGWLAEQISQGVGGVASGIEGMAAPLEAGVSDIGRTQLAGMGHPLPGQAALTPELLKQGAKSASETLSGLFQIATPAFAAEFMAAPLKTASGFALFAGVDATTKAALEKAGVPEEYRDLFGQLAGVAAGSIPFMRMGQDAAHKILRDAFPHFWGEAEAGRAEPPPPGDPTEPKPPEWSQEEWEKETKRRQPLYDEAFRNGWKGYNESFAEFEQRRNGQDWTRQAGEPFRDWRRRTWGAGSEETPPGSNSENGSGKANPDFEDWYNKRREQSAPPPEPPPPSDFTQRQGESADARQERLRNEKQATEDYNRRTQQRAEEDRRRRANDARNRRSQDAENPIGADGKFNGRAPTLRAAFKALGLDETATWDQVKAAFRAKQYANHSDRAQTGADPEKLLLYNAAFEVLTDEFNVREKSAAGKAEEKPEKQGYSPRSPNDPRQSDANWDLYTNYRYRGTPDTFDEWYKKNEYQAKQNHPPSEAPPPPRTEQQPPPPPSPGPEAPPETAGPGEPPPPAGSTPPPAPPPPSAKAKPDAAPQMGDVVDTGAGGTGTVVDTAPLDGRTDKPLTGYVRIERDGETYLRRNDEIQSTKRPAAPTAPGSQEEPATTKNGESVHDQAPSSAPSVAPSPDKPDIHDYSSTQANLPRNISAPLQAFGATIPKDQLGEKGVESESHVTVRYGNPGTDPAPIQKALEGEGPITVTLGKASIFHTDDGDVLKVSVDSPDLHRLNTKVGDAVEHTGETFQDYKPHVTIAYLKKGEGEKYNGNSIPGVTGQQVTLNSVTFSGKDGKQTEIPLKGTSPSAPLSSSSPSAAGATVAVPGAAPALTPDGAREPWQMTREEYFSDPDLVRSHVPGGTPGFKVSYSYVNPGPAGPSKGSMVMPQSPKKGDVIPAMFGKATVTAISKAAPAKLDNQQLFDGGKIAHRQFVQDAIAAGKPVPTEVLADYPDLKPASVASEPQAASETPAKAESNDWRKWQRDFGTVAALHYSVGDRVTDEQGKQGVVTGDEKTAGRDRVQVKWDGQQQAEPAHESRIRKVGGPIPSGTFMNEGDIEEAVERFKKHPVLSRATKFIQDLREEANAHSDGWHSWPAPTHAAARLMGMIQHPEYATEANFKKALAPIRAFYTKRGNAAGMKFPNIGEPTAPSASPAVPAPGADGGAPDAASTPNAPAPTFPSTKLNPPARAKALAAYRRWFYTPGNVVSGYGGEFDKVLQYDEKPGGTWNVQVVHSDKEGNPLPKEQPRWHATPPDKDYRVVTEAAQLSTPPANASESTQSDGGTRSQGEQKPSAGPQATSQAPAKDSYTRQGKTEADFRKERDDRIALANGNIYLTPKDRKAEIDGAKQRYATLVDLLREETNPASTTPTDLKWAIDPSPELLKEYHHNPTEFYEVQIDQQKRDKKYLDGHMDRLKAISGKRGAAQLRRDEDSDYHSRQAPYDYRYGDVERTLGVRAAAQMRATVEGRTQPADKTVPAEADFTAFFHGLHPGDTITDAPNGPLTITKTNALTMQAIFGGHKSTTNMDVDVENPGKARMTLDREKLEKLLYPETADESDQDRSYREWTENFDRVARNPEAASEKDLRRAINFLDHRRSSIIRKAQEEGRTVSAEALQSYDTEQQHYMALIRRHEAGTTPAVPAPGADGGAPDAASTTETPTTEGPGFFIAVTGKKTFPLKDRIKRIPGATWNKDEKAWILPDNDVSRKAITAIGQGLGYRPFGTPKPATAPAAPQPSSQQDIDNSTRMLRASSDDIINQIHTTENAVKNSDAQNTRIEMEKLRKLLDPASEYLEKMPAPEGEKKALRSTIAAATKLYNDWHMTPESAQFGPLRTIPQDANWTKKVGMDSNVASGDRVSWRHHDGKMHEGIFRGISSANELAAIESDDFKKIYWSPKELRLISHPEAAPEKPQAKVEPAEPELDEDILAAADKLLDEKLGKAAAPAQKNGFAFGVRENGKKTFTPPNAGQVFATEEEAQEAGNELMSRWYAIDAIKVGPVDAAPNYRFDKAQYKAVRLEEKPAAPAAPKAEEAPLTLLDRAILNNLDINKVTSLSSLATYVTGDMPDLKKLNPPARQQLVEAALAKLAERNYVSAGISDNDQMGASRNVEGTQALKAAQLADREKQAQPAKPRTLTPTEQKAASKPAEADPATIAGQAARDRMRARRNKPAPLMSRDPEAPAPSIAKQDLVDLSAIGAEHMIVHQATAYKDWTARMMADVGDLLTDIADETRQTPADVLRTIHGYASTLAGRRGVKVEAPPVSTPRTIEKAGEESILGTDAPEQSGGTDRTEPVEGELPEGSGTPGEVGDADPVGGVRGQKVGRGRKPGAGKRSKLQPGGGNRVERVGPAADVERQSPPRSGSVDNNRHEHDYRIPDNRIISGSPETRAKNNLNAIRVLREIQQENRAATVEEQEVLAGYVGWGAVPQLFAGNTPEWKAQQDVLRNLLDNEEFALAQNSTKNAHFTADPVVDDIWGALVRMGAKPGMNWLEPAVGVGTFFGRQPAQLLEGSRRIGVDKDSISAQITKLLYPDSGIENAPFETVELPKDYFDGTVSNVPFADVKVHDPEFRNQKYLTSSVHNYFFAKSLGNLKPGGVMAFITSTFTMDGYGQGTKAFRRWIAERADFLGAVRLPSNAFMQSSGTHVITDIIFLQKRLPGAERAGEDWIETKNKQLQGTYGVHEVPVNDYYSRHPENVLGKERLNRGQFSDHDYYVEGQLTPGMLAKALKRIPGQFQQWNAGTEAPKRVAIRELVADVEDAKLGALFFDEKGNLYRKTSQGAAEAMDVTPEAKKKIKGQLEIRNALMNLLELERQEPGDVEVETETGAGKQTISPEKVRVSRLALGIAYQRYVNEHGPLSSPSNRTHMAGDPDAPLLVSLERKWDPQAKTAARSPIFDRRMLPGPRQAAGKAADAKDALYISLNETGVIDFERMQALTGKPEAELKQDLKGIIYHDPETRTWEMADDYLSGSVRAKLRQARAIAKLEPEFEENVKALELSQPEDIPPGKIRAGLGATWVPIDTYTDFATEILNSSTPTQVRYAGGRWYIDEPQYYGAKAKNQWSTNRVDAGTLMQDALNMKRAKVYDYDSDKKRDILNVTETQAAQAKQQEIQDYFEKYLMADNPARTDIMVRLYNDAKNDLRLPTFDGSHLTLPEIVRDPQIVTGGDLAPHQKNAIWRGIKQRNLLIAHSVGTGKTFELIAMGMELKRLGMIQRPMYVVPNATLGGWQLQFNQLYPQKRVIVFSEKDLEKENRRATIARIATGDWDAVVMPESSFKLIRTGDDIFNEHFHQLEKELDESIREAEGAGMDTRMVKRMEKSRDKLLAGLQDRRNETAQDNTVIWEQLGIDWLAVDESHHYRKLGFTTKQQNIAGIDTNGNQKTFDLLMKMRHVQKFGRGVVFATGTPIVNTIGEMFSLMRYLIEPEMQARGIGRFDEWSADYARTIPVFEPKVEGGGYRFKDRFARIVNIPELANLFRSFADVVTADMVDVHAPPLAGGARKMILTELSDEQNEFLDTLRGRGANIRRDPRGALPDNMLSVYTDAAKMALDIRMVMPNAPDVPGSRLNEAARTIFRDWQDSSGTKGAQAVFCDWGKPDEYRKVSERGGFQVYTDLIDKLVKQGIPREQIAVIHQARNKDQRARLFQQINDGDVRVVIGSTQKMGEGVNIQQRLYSIHHLDLPATPAELDQREGRGLRQGNTNPDVRVYYYMTRGSLDEMKFANVLRKAVFINAMLQGKSSVREADDVGDMIPSLEAFQAATSGDPRVMRKMEVDAEVSRLENIRYAFRNQQWSERRELAELPGTIASAENKIRDLNADIALRDSSPKFWTVLGEPYEGKTDAAAKAFLNHYNEQRKAYVDASDKAIKEATLAATEKFGGETEAGLKAAVTRAVHAAQHTVDGQFPIKAIATYAGFTVDFDPTRHGWNSLDLKGKSRTYGLDLQDTGAGTLASAAYKIAHLEKGIEEGKAAIEKAKRDEEQLKLSLAKPWPYQNQFDELEKEQSTLTAALEGKGDTAVMDDGEEVNDASVEGAESGGDEEGSAAADPKAAAVPRRTPGTGTLAEYEKGSGRLATPKDGWVVEQIDGKEFYSNQFVLLAGKPPTDNRAPGKFDMGGFWSREKAKAGNLAPIQPLAFSAAKDVKKDQADTKNLIERNLWFSNGVSINAKYYDAILKAFPDATFSQNSNNQGVIFISSKGIEVGLVGPLASEAPPAVKRLLDAPTPTQSRALPEEDFDPATIPETDEGATTQSHRSPAARTLSQENEGLFSRQPSITAAKLHRVNEVSPGGKGIFVHNGKVIDLGNELHAQKAEKFLPGTLFGDAVKQMLMAGAIRVRGEEIELYERALDGKNLQLAVDHAVSEAKRKHASDIGLEVHATDGGSAYVRVPLAEVGDFLQRPAQFVRRYGQVAQGAMFSRAIPGYKGQSLFARKSNHPDQGSLFTERSTSADSLPQSPVSRIGRQPFTVDAATIRRLPDAPSPAGQTATHDEIAAFWGATGARATNLGGRPALLVNIPGMEVVLRRMGLSGKDQSSKDVLGITLTPKEWSSIIEAGKQAQLNPRSGGFDDALIQLSNQIQQAMGTEKSPTSTGLLADSAAAPLPGKPVSLQTVVAEARRQEQYQLPRGEQSPEQARKHAAGTTKIIQEEAQYNGGYLLADVPTDWFSVSKIHVDPKRQARLEGLGGSLDPAFVIDYGIQDDGRPVLSAANGNNRIQYAKDHGQPTVKAYVNVKAWEEVGGTVVSTLPPASNAPRVDGVAERPSRAPNVKASEAANPFSALKPLIVVQASNRIPDNVLKRVGEEESDHALQMELPEGLQGLPLEIVETPAGQKAAASLTRIGYPKLNPQSPFYEHNRALIAAEIGARLMRPGRYKELDLTAQEARQLTEAHIQGLAKHGDKADSIIELLYAALKENPAFEGRTGSVEDHHQAPGARRPEKPRGPPTRTGPDVPGNQAHGGQTPPPDIPRAPRGGTARPEPGGDTGNQPLQARRIIDPDEPQPEINYDARGYFEDLLKPGGNLGQLEKASIPSHTAALRAASARGEANVIMHAVMPAISRTLAGSGFTAEQLRTAYIESRLRGMKQFWSEAADQTRAMSDQQLHDAFKDHFLFLLRAIEDKRQIFHNVAQAAASFVESGGDLINPATSYMPPAQVARYYEQLRRFLGATFDDAAAAVWADGHPQALMSPAEFDSILDASRNNPKVRMAHQIYKNDVEQAMRDSHLENEGVLTQNLGPFQTYIPLVPLNRPQQSGGMVAGQPWNPPRNPNNHFATGLGEGYDVTLPAFREKLARALRTNSRAMLLHTLREAGILQDPVPGQDHIEFQGRTFYARSVIVKMAGTIIQNGKVTQRPAKMGVLPLAFYKEIEPILEHRPMDPDSIKRVVQWVNTIALKGPAEFAMHSTGLMGVLVANTPFLGTSLADKALSLPLIKKVAAIVKVMSEDQDPTTPENAALLRQMAKVGALPSKFATVTYSQKYAEETGSERERFSFTPLLYGPKGIDARARLLIWKIAQAVNPGATAQEMYHFVNQLGNYTPELQSKAEGFFKGTGFGPFFTAGSTRIVNGAGALTGTSPMPGKGWGPRAWQALVSGVGFLALYAAAYHALTGKWPWNDKRFKMLKIPVSAGGSGWIDKYRHSETGNLLWGKGPETGYIDFGAANPLALRGLRAMGLASAIEAKIEGGDGMQVAEAAGKDLLNAYLHPTMGPAARLGTVAAFGIEPYVTGVNPPKFMAATPKKLKPGFVGGLAPGLYPHTAERAHAGVEATLGARAAAALGQLNSFYGSLGEATGFLGNEGYSKGNPALRMGLGLASPILPIGAGNASNPFARNEALRRERASR